MERKRLHQAIDEYQNKKEKTLKGYSFHTIEGKIKRLKELFADLYLDEITKEEIQDYVDDWKNKYSINTIKSYVQIILSVLKENNYYVQGINIKNDKPPKEHKIYDNNEIEKICKYFETSKKIKINHLPIIIAIYTGMRIGEILALQWLDVDLDKGRIEITKDVAYTKKGNIIQTPKTLASYRTITIPEQLKLFLIQFRPINSDEWEIFISSGKNKPSCSRNIMRSAELLLCKIGVEYKGFHAFRHYYATRMLERNVNPKIVGDLLGHSNIATTLNIYSHTSNDLKSEIVKCVFEDENYKREQEKKELYKQILEMQKTMNELLLKVSNL